MANWIEQGILAEKEMSRIHDKFVKEEVPKILAEGGEVDFVFDEVIITLPKDSKYKPPAIEKNI